MASNLDMSLDDMIKNRSNSARGRGRGRGWGRAIGRGGTIVRRRAAGPPRRGPLGVNSQPTPYTIAKSFSRAKDLIWQNDLFNDSMIAAGLTGIETGTKLYVSNLDAGVSNEDIKELFCEVGILKRCAVHYDRNGRSSGSAEVVFLRRSDAFAAMRRYNNVLLDGKPMKVEVIGSNLGMPRVNVVGGPSGRGRPLLMKRGMGRGSFGTTPFNQRIGTRGRGNFVRGRRSGIRGRGRGRRQQAEISAEELDRELETYQSQAMHG